MKIQYTLQHPVVELGNKIVARLQLNVLYVTASAEYIENVPRKVIIHIGISDVLSGAPLADKILEVGILIGKLEKY